MIFSFKSAQIFACGLQRNRKTLPCVCIPCFFSPGVQNKVESLLAQKTGSGNEFLQLRCDVSLRLHYFGAQDNVKLSIRQVETSPVA